MNDQWEHIHQEGKYDKYESTLDWQIGYSRVEELISPEGKRILDYGCGTGKFTRKLAQSAEHIIGVDISESAIKCARMQSNASIDYFLVEKGCISPLAPGSIDAAVATFTFCSIQTEEEITSILQQLYRALSEDGTLTILDPNPNAPGHHYSTVQRTEPRQRIAGSPVDVTLKGVDAIITNYWRPLDSYIRCLTNAGFVIETLEEPLLEGREEETQWKDERTSAPYLIIEAKKGGK